MIPNFVFSTSSKDLEDAGKSKERAKSPGPNHYRPQSAYVLSKRPRATIGNTVREISEKNLSIFKQERPKSPGPSDYKRDRSITDGPKYTMARKYVKMM